MYKALFEFRVLHQYYLSGKDGKSILDTSDVATGQQERYETLSKKFNARVPSITEDLDFSLAEAYESEYKKYDLKLLPTYSGFKVLVPVKELLQADGSFFYKPIKALPSSLSIVIMISRKGPFIDAITNGRLSKNFHAGYFFTNQDLNGNKRFPVISEPVSARDPNYQYEQGELYRAGNTLFTSFYDKDGNEMQVAIADSAFVNENDRKAAPPRFIYYFRDAEKISEYSFTLKDATGSTLQTITGTSPSLVKYVTLDFSRSIGPVPGEGLKDHELEVVATGNYRRNHTLSFVDVTDQSKVWGWINILQQSGPAAFRLFDSSGNLTLRADKNRKETGLPVFEIWLKSRPSFWRYKNNKGKEIKQKADLDFFFDYEGGEYVSKSLREASYVPTEFKAAGPGSRFFPNPLSYDLLVRENKRVYTEILVPHSTVFET